MRTLVLKMNISLDCFVGGPKGELDWVFENADPEATDWVVRSISKASLHLMGSGTFQGMVSTWPTSTEPYAPAMNQIPKAVFSNRGRAVLAGAETTQALKDAARARAAAGQSSAELQPGAESWAATEVISGDLADGIRRLKSIDGKPIIAYGGARFAQSLITTGLIDQFELLVQPVALGAGLPLFSKLSAPKKLRLVSATPFPRGAVGQIYRPT
jgi:dihydrofolate reductase